MQEYEDSFCTCGCGQPRSVAYDKTKAFKVDKFTCYAGRALAQVERTWRDKNENAAEGWSDGVHHYVVPHETDD